VARFNQARGFPMRRETLLHHLFTRGWEDGGQALSTEQMKVRPSSSRELGRLETDSKREGRVVSRGRKGEEVREAEEKEMRQEE